MPTIGREEFEKKLLAKEWLERKNIQLIMLAYKLAKYGHRNQRRDGGESYFEHPKRVALILMDECGYFNSGMLISALLHDIKEDSFILSWEDIGLIFGEQAEKMIRLLTKENEAYLKQIENAPENVKIIKLADRLDNIRDLCGCSLQKREKYLKETAEFYLPLAEKTHRHLHHLISLECAKYQKSC